MANETEAVQLNLGALRSAMSLTLHTHQASRVWHGRAQGDNKPGIMGLNGFVAIMNRLRHGAEQDDPYSDFWMLRIEEKLADTKQQLQLIREQVDQALAGVPPALSIGENLNVQPVKLPLFVSSQLGFMAVYLLADYDELARRLILAHHTALIDRLTLERWLNEGAHALRSLFSLAQQYRFSGTTRDDFASMNAAARAALEKFGELPPDVLDGTRRSRFAPPTRRGRQSSQPTGSNPSDDGRTDDDGDTISAEDELAATRRPLVPVPVVRRQRPLTRSSRAKASREAPAEALGDEAADAAGESLEADGADGNPEEAADPENGEDDRA
ncbi:conjugal transfer protein [Brucella anthropi]|nr:conjugal transfer protein [Brucella anthropi]